MQMYYADHSRALTGPNSLTWCVYKRTSKGDVTILTGNSDWCGLAAQLFNEKEEAQWK